MEKENYASNYASIDINACPKSSKSEICIDKTGSIKIYLNSPPVDGKANIEIIKLLSQKLKIAKSYISIDKGEKGKKKRVLITGMSTEEVLKKLHS